ncbi:hypothetical protein KQI82_04955 [Oscillibacter sp. MSJ-2]|uniref:Uncharacterized protein n=1 Tax=Dysosmobacter acutus TaxID=2841504 RepID=A0ABS6F8A3_9FIRM|nr:hypothetical protein [Dysosmobacter acutus]MBU5626270.1 hypothetical protein [Dysosmobacter acutus]
MWLSRQLRSAQGTAELPAADLGVTTISGDSAGVLARGEVRNLPVMGPGGFAWKPDNGTAALLIRGGTGAEECCVAGVEDPEGKDLEPGEVLIHSNGASIRLNNNGEIHLSGRLYINGEEYQAPVIGE